MHRSALPALLVAAALGAAGCSSSRSGPNNSEAVFNKVTGDLTTQAEVSLDEAFEATRTAIEELEFRTVESETAKDALQGHVVARDAADNKVNVRLEKVSDHVTGIEIDLGAFGNEAKARMILDKIKENMGR